jgi:transcriptional regulator with XRE-family HTH domain
VIIGDRLRKLREKEGMSRGDMPRAHWIASALHFASGERTHGPTIESLEKMARALGIPLYQIFYDGPEPPDIPEVVKLPVATKTTRDSSGKEASDR